MASPTTAGRRRCKAPPSALILALLAATAAAARAQAGLPAAVAGGGPDDASAGAGAATLGGGVKLTWHAVPPSAAHASTAGSGAASSAAPSIVFNVRFDPAEQGGGADGYLGIGLSEMGSMKGADIWLLHQDENGRWHLGDYHAAGFVTPQLDKSQDLTLLSAERAPSGAVTASFRRALRPCDAGGPAGGEDIAIEPGVPLYVIWARGAWPLSYHGPSDRGSRLVTLVPEPAATAATTAAAGPNASPAAATPHAPLAPHTRSKGHRLLLSGGGGGGGVTGAAAGRDSSVAAAAASEAPKQGRRFIQLTLPPLTVPFKSPTTYLTKYIKLPSDRPYWLVRSGPLFNNPHVHHAVVYGCAPEAAAAIASLAATAGPGPYPQSTYPLLCHNSIVITTPNMRPLTFPPNMGVRLPEWVALEVHYNNPDFVPGAHDPGSGAWLELADRGIKTDVALLTLGQFYLNIPPGQPEVTAPPAICPSACTKRFRAPVTLLYQGFHMHGTGKRAITRRWRDGRELSPLFQHSSWDYGFQTMVPVAQSKSTLMPGDHLELTCTFDSRGRANRTTWGFGTNDEMCFHYIFYAPAQADLGFCSTFGDGSMPGKPTRLAACASDYFAVSRTLTIATRHPRNAAAAAGLRALEAEGAVIPIPPSELSAIAAAAPYRPPSCAPMPPSPAAAGAAGPPGPAVVGLEGEGIARSLGDWGEGGSGGAGAALGR